METTFPNIKSIKCAHTAVTVSTQSGLGIIVATSKANVECLWFRTGAAWGHVVCGCSFS